MNVIWGRSPSPNTLIIIILSWLLNTLIGLRPFWFLHTSLGEYLYLISVMIHVPSIDNGSCYPLTGISSVHHSICKISFNTRFSIRLIKVQPRLFLVLAMVKLPFLSQYTECNPSWQKLNVSKIFELFWNLLVGKVHCKGMLSKMT